MNWGRLISVIVGVVGAGVVLYSFLCVLVKRFKE